MPHEHIMSGSLAPTEFEGTTRAYLRGRGWQMVSPKGRGGTWHLVVSPRRDYELLQPDVDTRDFPKRLEDFLSTLSKVEGRSVSGLVRDLRATWFDRVSVRAAGEAIGDGAIPIDSGMDVIRAAREMLLSAACSTELPRASHRGRRPEAAVEYIRRVRLEPIQMGSFVVSVLCPVEQPIEASEERVLSREMEDPGFGRKVTLLLASALKATTAQAKAVEHGDDIRSIDPTVKLGVTSNLCESVASALSVSEAENICIEFSWSPIFIQSVDVPSKFTFDKAQIPILQEFAKRLSSTSQQAPATVVRGQVVRLFRDSGASEGAIVVDSWVDEKRHKVKIPLGTSEYNAAIDAHKEGREVSFRGEVVKRAGQFRLDDAIMTGV